MGLGQIAESTVLIRIVTQGEKRAEKLKKSLQQTQQVSEKLKRSLKGTFSNAVTGGINKANAALQKFNRELVKTGKLQRGLKKTGNFLGGKGSALRSAVIGAGAGLAARSAFGAASQKESTGVRVEILQKEFKQLEGIQESAARSAEKFILSETQVLQSYIDLGNRLGESGASIADLENIYDGLNTVLVKNRASTQEAASATLQLNQALGAGKLQGEEFRAINEAAPQVISEVAKVLGVARGEVKQLAADGLVSSKVLIQALTNIKTKGASQLEEGFTGAFGATRRYDKAVQELSEAVGEKLLPAITPLIEGLTNLINGFVQLDPSVQTAIVGFTALGVVLLIAAPGLVALGKAAGAAVLGLGALGAKLGLVTAASGKLSLALAGLKVAMLALPWVALAAGVAAATVAVVNHINKERELNELLEGNSNDLKAYNDAIYNHRGELAKAEKRLDEMITSGYEHAESILAQKKEVERLREELERLVAQDYQVNVRVNYENLLNAKDVMAENFSMDKVNAILKNSQSSSPKPTKTKKGGGAKPRESQVPALEREVALKEKLNDLDKQILEAQLEENSALVETLSIDRLRAELQGQIADINAEEIPDQEKKLQIYSAQLDSINQIDQVLAQSVQRVKDEQQAIEDALEPLREQRALLDAQLAGRGEEQRIVQEIETIMKGLPEAERARVEALVRGNAEREKELEKLAEIEAFQKQIADRIKRGLEDALVGTLEAAIDKTKDLGEELQKIASTLLKDLGRMFLRAGINGIGAGLNLPGMAAGGFVDSPTTAIVGEGGSDEYVIPANKMSSAMSRYSSGARGDAVINGADGSGDGGGTAVAEAPTSINIEGGVMQFNDTNYIRQDQVPMIISQASKQGEARALRRLQMSPAARRKAGV